MMVTPLRIVMQIGIVVSAGLIRALPSAAWEIQTHRVISQEAVESSSANQVLRLSLGIEQGIRAVLDGREIREWVAIGSEREDDFTIFPFGRFLHHFHHPLRLWDRAGLSNVFSGTSSAIWAQTREQSALGTGSWSWQETRDRFHLALTSEKNGDRDKFLAQTFRGLGHQVHLIQDAVSVPHARNEAHPPPHFNLEKWTRDRLQTRRPTDFARLLQQTPRVLLDPELLREPPNPLAPIPISKFIDADRYTGENPDATSVLRDGLDAAGQPTKLAPVGLAEYTNANFAHRNTIFTDTLPQTHKWWSPYPRRSSTNLAALGLPEEVTAEDGQVDRTVYIRKERDGERIEHFLKASYVATFTDELGRPTNFRLQFTLDDKVYEDYVRLLLPRAVGYSIGLLDYFFRGKLDVDLVEDSEDPSLLRLVGTNGSEEPLVDGTLKLYADNPEGQRVEAGALDSTSIANVAKDQPLPALRFQAPEGTERFVAVYEGTMGEEKKDPGRNFPGAVIGKVLGGVRVEEVFSDGTRWQLRTPQGIFPLPILAEEIVQLRWGDRDNTLVGRTKFGPERPNQFVAYEINRPVGSTQVPLVAGSDGSQHVDVTILKRVTFPFDVDLGTTVDLTHTIEYKQYLVSFVHTTTYEFIQCPEPPDPPKPCNYQVKERSVSDGRIDLLTQDSRTLSQSNAIILDRDHLLRESDDFPSEDQLPPPPGSDWFVEEFALTRAGKILALVHVFPPDSPASTTFTAFVLTVDSGADGDVVPKRVPSDRPPPVEGLKFPDGIRILLSALVDVEEGRVLASTAPAVVNFEHTTPLNDFTSPLLGSARMFRKERFQGGLLDGVYRYEQLPDPKQHPWTDLFPKPCPGGTSVLELVTVLEGTLAGQISQFRPELAQVQFSSPIDEVQSEAQYFFLCPTTDDLSAGFKIITKTGVFRPSHIDGGSVLRARPGAEGEQLVLLVHQGQLRQDPGGPNAIRAFQSRLAVWHPEQGRSETRQEFLVPGFYFLDVQPGASSLAAVSSQAVLVGGVTPGEQFTTFVGLQGPPRSFTFSRNSVLENSFVLLEPELLYNTEDLRFYRKQSPLQPTPLPAKLAPLPPGPTPRGEYHAVKIK